MPRTNADRPFPYYPAFLDLRRKHVVVVGAGIIATGKVRGLLPCGPDPLIVIAPKASQFVVQTADAGRLTWLARSYTDGDLAGADVCFAATGDRALNARVAEEARRRKILVLAVDDIPSCDFIAPSVVTRGDLIIAMSTGGRSPAFARWVRERFDRDVPAHWGALLDVVATARERLGSDRARVTPETWLAAIDDALEDQVREGDKDGAVRMLMGRLLSPLPLGEGQGEGVTDHSEIHLDHGTEDERTPGSTLVRKNCQSSQSSAENALTLALSQRERGQACPRIDGQSASTTVSPEPGRVGFVSLVGAGPGDPELLTLKGLRRLREADAVVHDRLVGAEILDLCRPDVERYDVGKSSGHHRRPQEEINALLIRLAREGLRVVRLKGGDPFVFGRGGEEVLALARAEVPCEIVPGVSSALAAPAAAGIPVTHRGLASSVTIATGHARDGCGEEHDWNALAQMPGTLVFLMAVENLEHIVESLLTSGRRADEPAAMVESATTLNQRTVRASLGTIVETARRAEIVAPAVLVIGETVALADVLAAQPQPWDDLVLK